MYFIYEESLNFVVKQKFKSKRKEKEKINCNNLTTIYSGISEIKKGKANEKIIS